MSFSRIVKFWHPNLATIRATIEDFWRSDHRKRGYQFVFTPHIASAELYKYGRQIMDTLTANDVRAILDDRSETINYRIRESQVHKIP